MVHTRRHPTRALLLVAATLLLASPVAAQRPTATAARAAVAQPAPQLSARQLRELDAHVEAAMRQWEIPGLALAIVQGDSVVHARGYGVRAQGAPEPVDEHTLFAMGSNGKTFTSALAAILVDEGKMRWDDEVWRHLPGFRVADPYVSRHATIRDVLSHRTSVQDALAFWYGSTLSTAEILDRLRFLEQGAGFRGRFLYSNLMMVVAGEATAAAAGRPWSELLRERLFEPLGMTRSALSARTAVPKGNVATPHMPLRGPLITVQHFEGGSMAPAGALYSSAHDMAQWVRFHLGNGTYLGNRLISERSMREMRTVVTPSGVPHLAQEEDRTNYGYGLGWFLGTYRGHRAIWHGGAIDGMLSDMQLLPDARVGVIVLTNRSPHSMHGALVRHIFDVVLGLPERDWNGEALAREKEREANVAARRDSLKAARDADAKPLFPLERYAGVYSDSLNGSMAVEAEAARLVLRYHPGYVAYLEPWRYNTFEVLWQRPGALNRDLGFVTFHFDASGQPTELVLDGIGTFRAAPRAPEEVAGAGAARSH